ncbi:hypothetical protein C8R43DRAFT_955397 [Mycena crocata]|nr:hypothetical protein C8R43DRAFT_955397 [Mycena crocata]
MIVKQSGEGPTEAKQSRPHFTHSPSSQAEEKRAELANDGTMDTKEEIGWRAPSWPCEVRGDWDTGDGMEGAKLAMRGYKGTQKKMGWRASSWPCAARRDAGDGWRELRWLLPRSRSIASSSLHTLFAAVCIFISYVLNCSGLTELQDLLWANPVGDCMASRRPVPDSPRATVVDEILPTQPFLGERRQRYIHHRRTSPRMCVAEKVPNQRAGLAPRARGSSPSAVVLIEHNARLKGETVAKFYRFVPLRKELRIGLSYLRLYSTRKSTPKCRIDAILRQLIKSLSILSNTGIQNQPNKGNNTRGFERETREYASMRTSENHLGGEVVGHRDRAWTDGTEGAKLVMRGIDGLGCSIAGLRMDRWDGGR